MVLFSICYCEIGLGLGRVRVGSRHTHGTSITASPALAELYLSCINTVKALLSPPPPPLEGKRRNKGGV